MLVLTRRLKESIMIGDDIEITIVSIDGEQVKIGIDAPKQIEIHRKEIFIDIQKSNHEAAQTKNITINLQQMLKLMKMEQE
jgi:carbon storage regulator